MVKVASDTYSVYSDKHTCNIPEIYDIERGEKSDHAFH